MLIASNNLPSVAQNYAASLFVENVQEAVPSLVSELSLTQTQNYAILSPSIIPDFFEANLASLSISTVTLVTLNNSVYQSTNNPTPNVGFYYLDKYNNILRINPGYDATGLSISYLNLSGLSIKLNRVALPRFFSQYLVVGAFNVTLSFRSHPSAQVVLRCHKTQLPTIRNGLKNGTPLTLFGVGFRVSRFIFKEVKDNLKNIEINITLGGYWQQQGDTIRSPLDKPIREKDLVRNQSDQAGFQYSYSGALQRVGISLQGGNVIKKTGRTLSDNQTTTGRQLLQDEPRLLVSGYYIDWNSPAGPTLRRWNSPSIYWLDPMIVDLSTEGFPQIEIAENGFGAEVNGCQLAHELSNATLELDQDPDQGQEGDRRICLLQGNPNPQAPPQELKGGFREAFDYTRLRSPSYCFDAGESTSKEIIRCQLNGSDLEVTERTYGFVYSTADVYEVRIKDGDDGLEASFFFRSLAEVSLAVDWRIVREIIYTYTYDDRTGYYQNKKGKGWELTRVLTETDEKEAINLAAAIAEETDPQAIANLQRHLSGYTNFFKRTITGEEVFQLADLRDHYKDLRKADESQKNYVAPLYPKETTTEENSLLIVADPRSTVDDPQPDLAIGERNSSYTTTEINSTNPEKFIQWNPITNQSGTNLEASAYSESFTENAGRPSLQPRLQESTGHHAPQQEDLALPKYRVSTPGSPNSEAETKTLSYPGAYRLAQALKAARTEYSIKNSQDSCTSTFPLRESPFGLRPGDVGMFEGERWRIFTLSFSGQIQPGNAIFTNVSLEVGKDLDVPILLEVVG